MSWRKIPMKFAGKCAECGADIAVGTSVMWLKGEGVKHPECVAGAPRIQCIVCGRPAGCAECESRDDCDLARVSQMCICRTCAEEDALAKYGAAVLKKFTILNPSRTVGQSTLA